MGTGRHCGCRTSCNAATAMVLVLVLVAVVISLVVIFKVKPPMTHVSSITPRNVTVALDLARLQVHLNMTLGVDLSLKNPNRASFEYGNSSAMLSYRGEFVGEAPIPAGEVLPNETKRMELILTVMADRLLLSNSALISDVAAGRIVFTSYTRLSGKVRFFGAVKVRGSTTARCEFSVFIGNNTIGDQSCKYKTN
ncbi:hypothetical protein MLD38_030038 [Melastoma candidum]|uniref:Uncharacterized protein n=1 Tax=Melastoma candidum TaxID=119954 RepID=A0ACB9MMC1_9MYRT|nr:hypothetical protein MLD38_030038 [Melastoma candidum]